ncbi:hypothetical protein FK531_14805 [Rhodococcus spelaei]|uniref:Uncharacterized protein n=1 Tax=Rhodococcus spelaei TaxID=2546320 RepID=A0A541B7R4_9NOCA|nr:hypothetical protein [Rhodococcus spelaei]TQF68354.1 hypothetical protein FK531_14805 [Rhodococcus spelaei]
MSWSDVHARTAIIETVLERATADAQSPLLFANMPDAERLFGGVDGLILALQHRWTNHLAAKLDQAIEDGTPPYVAWDELAAEQPGLRAVLDRFSPQLRSARRAQGAESASAPTMAVTGA